MTTQLALTALSASDRGRLVADVSTAGSIAAPYWPLTAFVAVNPLGGLTNLAFADATAAARGWFGARTHLPLEAYRAEHARGTVTDADLDRAILRHDPSLVDRQPLDVGAELRVERGHHRREYAAHRSGVGHRWSPLVVLAGGAGPVAGRGEGLAAR